MSRRACIPRKGHGSALPRREEKRILIEGQFARALGQALITLEPIRLNGSARNGCAVDQISANGAVFKNESIGF